MLSGEKLKDDEQGHIPWAKIRGDSISKLSVARSQYLSLHKKKTSTNPLPRLRTEKLEAERKSATPSTQWVPTPPPLPTPTPKKTTGSHSGQPPLPNRGKGVQGTPKKPAVEARGGTGHVRPNKKTNKKKISKTPTKRNAQPDTHVSHRQIIVKIPIHKLCGPLPEAAIY